MGISVDVRICVGLCVSAFVRSCAHILKHIYGQHNDSIYFRNYVRKCVIEYVRHCVARGVQKCEMMAKCVICVGVCVSFNP